MSIANPNGIVTTAGKTLKARWARGETPGGLNWIGVGAGTWADKTAPPSESAAATALAAEIARKLVSRSSFLQEDAAGTITFNGKKYKEVATAGPIVAFFATFDEADIQGAQIAEEGLFGGTIVTTASPLALAAQVTTPGVLYWVRHRPLFVKQVRDSYEVIAIFSEE